VPLWSAATVPSLLLPVYLYVASRKNAAMRAQMAAAPAANTSVVERFGLFTIIVLGEVIVGVVNGVAGYHHLTWFVGLIAALGMLVAIGVWWLYFDFISFHLPRNKQWAEGLWFYTHLPLTMGIVLIGAALLNVITHSQTQLTIDARWLLVGSTAMTIFSMSMLMHAIQVPKTHQRLGIFGRWAMKMSSILILALGFVHLDILYVLILLVFFILAPVLFGFKIWIKSIVDKV
jgi:low temperature requirement protein LtrA